MTTNKPEVVAWGVPNSRLTERQPFMQLLHTQEGTQYPELLDPLIRLSDYEALQAENERLRCIIRDLKEVYNHGTSHDHPVIQEKLWEPTMEVWLPESGHADGIWKGKLSPERITTLESNRIYISYAAEYIADKIGAWPDLLAYPMGKVSNYTKNEYLPNYFHEHGTAAAFCTEIQARGPRPENYLQRGQDRWCLPRLTHGYSWRTPEEFLEVLRGTER